MCGTSDNDCDSTLISAHQIKNVNNSEEKGTYCCEENINYLLKSPRCIVCRSQGITSNVTLSKCKNIELVIDNTDRIF